MKSIDLFLLFVLFIMQKLILSVKKNTFLKLSHPVYTSVKQGSSISEKETIGKKKVIEQKNYEGNCFIKIHRNLFDLNKMTKNVGDEYLITTKEGKTITFNICSNVKTDCTDTKGLVVDKEKCIKFADTWKQDKKWVWKFDKETNSSRLILNLPKTEHTCHRGGPIITIFDILCDHNASETVILNPEEFSIDSCNNIIKMKSKYACSEGEFISWYSKLNGIGINKYIIGSFLGLFGLFFTIFGEHFFKITTCIIITCCSGLILKSILSPYYYLHFLTAMCLGIILAYLAYSIISLLNTVLVIIIAYFITNMAYNVLIKFIDMDPNSLYLIIFLICIILVLFLSHTIEKIIIIIATSLIGSFSTIRGLSLCVGGFPDETILSKLIEHREFNQVSRLFGGKAYVYLVAMFILFFVGVAFQSGLQCYNQRDKDNEKQSETQNNEKEMKI